MTTPTAPPGSLPPPTGLQSDARRQILGDIKRRGTMTVDQIVDAMAMSKTAVRAHLQRLESLGLVLRTQTKQPGRGRPCLAYRVSDDGAALFPSSDAAVLTELLRFLQDQGHTQTLQTFFDGLWAHRRTEFASALAEHAGSDAPTMQHRLTVLREVLERHHFMPRVPDVAPPPIASERRPDGRRRTPGLTVQVCHCPFPATVRATRLPCRLETAFMAEALGRPATVTTMSESRPECTFTFAPDDSER